MAAEKNLPTLLKHLRKTKQEDPEAVLFTEPEVKTIVHTLDPNQIRVALNFLLSTATTRDYSSIPVLQFLKRSLDRVALQQDESERNTDDILTGPTIAVLLTRKVEGKTVLRDQNVDEDNFKMMLALAWDAVRESPELIPEVREGILNLGDSDFINVQGCPLTSSTMTELMTQTNAHGETLLQEKTLNKSAYQTLLSLAMSASKDALNLIPEVRREIVNVENK